MRFQRMDKRSVDCMVYCLHLFEYWTCDRHYPQEEVFGETERVPRTAYQKTFSCTGVGEELHGVVEVFEILLVRGGHCMVALIQLSYEFTTYNSIMFLISSKQYGTGTFSALLMVFVLLTGWMIPDCFYQFSTPGGIKLPAVNLRFSAED